MNRAKKFKSLREVYLPRNEKISGVSSSEGSLMANIFGTVGSRQKIEQQRSRLDYRIWRQRFAETPGKCDTPFPERSRYGVWLDGMSKKLASNKFMMIGEIMEPRYGRFVERRLKEQTKIYRESKKKEVEEQEGLVDKTEKRVSLVNIDRMRSQDLVPCLWMLDRRGDEGSRHVFDYWRQTRKERHDFAEKYEGMLECKLSEHAVREGSRSNYMRYIVCGIADSQVEIEMIEQMIENNSPEEVRIVAAAISGEIMGGVDGISNAVQNIENPWKRADSKTLRVADLLKCMATKDLTRANIGLGGYLILTRSG